MYAKALCAKAIYNEPLIDVDSDNRLSVAVICLFVWVFYQFLVVCVPLIISHIFSCLCFLQESNPWWQVTLVKPLHVESVEITENIDCCPRDKGILNINVSTDETSLPSCTKSVSYGKSWDYKVRCSPPARGRYVTLKLIGNNVTLVLCQVVIRTIGKFSLLQ